MTRTNRTAGSLSYFFIHTYHPGCKKDISEIYSSITSWGGLTNIVYTQILNQLTTLMDNLMKLSLKHFLPWTTQPEATRETLNQSHFQYKGSGTPKDRLAAVFSREV